MILKFLLVKTSMIIYILSEPTSVTEILDKYEINQNKHAILALILKSKIVRSVIWSVSMWKACVSLS